MTPVGNNAPVSVGYKPQLVVALLMLVWSSYGVPHTRSGINTTNSLNIKDKEYAIQLPFSIRLFGDGKFSTLYVSLVQTSSLHNTLHVMLLFVSGELRRWNQLRSSYSKLKTRFYQNKSYYIFTSTLDARCGR